jgi:hypothetical protein
MAVIFAIIYWSMSAFNGDIARGSCVPGTDNVTLNKFLTLMSGAIDLLTALIGIFTTIFGRRSLNNWIIVYAESRTYNGEDPDKFKRNRKRMAERAFLYPLATCITLPIEAVFLIFSGLDRFIMILAILKNVTLGIAGLLTGIAFAVDPATHKAFGEAYLQITTNCINRKHINDNISEITVNIPLTNK